MLDIGWTELMVVAVILIVVVGPKDLPPMIRAFGKMTKRLRQTAGEFRAQFDEALREAELDDLKNSVNDIRSLNPANTIRETLNPLRQMGQEIKSDLERSTRPASTPVSSTQGVGENTILPDVPLGLGEPPEELKPGAQPPAAATASAAATATATAPATSAPAAISQPPAAKKTASRKPVVKADAPAKAAEKSAKTSSAAAVAAMPAEPNVSKKKQTVEKAAATKPVPADKVRAKPVPKPRKPKSEDRA